MSKVINNAPTQSPAQTPAKRMADVRAKIRMADITDTALTLSPDEVEALIWILNAGPDKKSTAP